MTREDVIANAIRQSVDTGQLAGAAALVWRQGGILQTVAVGRRDLTTALPIERDTIFSYCVDDEAGDDRRGVDAARQRAVRAG